MNASSDGARRIIDVCVAPVAGERIGLLVDDPVREPVARALTEAAQALGCRCETIPVAEDDLSSDLPSDAVDQRLLDFDVLIGLTGRSLYHASVGRAAAARGRRVLALTQCDLALLESPALDADFLGIAPYAERLADRLGHTDRIRVTSPAGTELVARLGPREGYACTGLARRSGERNGCPDIESYIAPIEDSVNGIVMVDVSSTPFGLVGHQIGIEVERGRARRFFGGPEAERLHRYLDAFGSTGLVFAEFGFGLNPRARVVGRIIEDEAVYGTGHVAFGSNVGFGGANEAGAHVDLVYRRPTLDLDGETVFSTGRFIADPSYEQRFAPDGPALSPSEGHRA